MEFLKKKVLVVGFGKSGLSAARWLSKVGAYITIGDIKKEDELNHEILKSARTLGVRLETGGHKEETFISSDIIIVSPGVPLDIAPLKAARRKNIPIIGELELAASLFDTPIVAVTGTNGKSTTVNLLETIIKDSGARLFVGGNIGTPLMDYVTGNLEADYVLAEVSSFQLDTISNFCPEVSLLLNISPDHLDRYSDYEAYVQSKFKIFQNQGPGQYAILNDDDERLACFLPTGGVSVLRYGINKRNGLNAFLDGNRLIAGLPDEETLVFDIESFPLPGRHNLENLMASVLAGLAIRLDPDMILDSLTGFEGLPHRMELVKSISGIDFYDDSKATNVDAALKSIQSFYRPIILIAGGRHKGGDYGPLVKAAKGKVKKAILIGESRELLARSFKGIVPFSVADSMGEAVSLAFSSAEIGDIVLLAPACSSFDMFSDYAHRGRIFREKTEELSNGN